MEGLFLCDGFTAWVIHSDGTIEDVEKSANRWAASTIVAFWDRVIPTTYANQTVWYYATTAGTTGGSEPTWGATTVTDGTVVWTKLGTYTGAKQYTNRSYSVGDLVQPATESGYFYKVTKAGTTSAEPTWSLVVGSTTIKDGVEFYNMGYYGGFPSPHLPMPCYLDSYVFLVSENTADIYNSYPANPFSWKGLDFISADAFTGPITAFARYNNYLAAFGYENTELFYDAANTTGSPLKRHDSFILQTGTVSPYCIVQSEMMLIWIGTSSLGSKTIWLLDGFDPKDIGTTHINRLLTAETDPLRIKGYGLRIDGHLFLVINLPTANKTILLDIGSTLWYEWSHNGGVFPFNHYADKHQLAIVQHTSGALYNYQKGLYQDTVGGTNYPITMQVTTDKSDFNINARKFIHSLDVIGDLSNTSCLIQWSDDDYQNWNTGYTVSMASRPRIARCGACRRRAHRITHTENAPFRIESLELYLTLGAH